MNESILLEALKEIIARNSGIEKDGSRTMTQDGHTATEAIKKFEDSSGKEMGMKWVKASERLPIIEKFEYPHNLFNIKYDGVPFQGILWKDNFYDSLTAKEPFDINYVEWLDESVPPYKEEVDKAMKKIISLYPKKIEDAMIACNNIREYAYNILESKEEAGEDKQKEDEK